MQNEIWKQVVQFLNRLRCENVTRNTAVKIPGYEELQDELEKLREKKRDNDTAITTRRQTDAYGMDGEVGSYEFIGRTGSILIRICGSHPFVKRNGNNAAGFTSGRTYIMYATVKEAHFYVGSML